MNISNAIRRVLIYVTVVYLILSTAIPHAGAQPTAGGPGPREPYRYSTFSPSMAIIIVVLISALLFMGLFSVYIRHCTGSLGVANVGSIGAGQVMARSRRGNRGLDLAVVETFPTFPYSTVKGLKIGKGALECAVCLNEFEDDDILRLLPKCDHVFHPECIDAWLSSHVTCPVCRSNLAVESVSAGEGNTLSTTVLNELDESNESIRSIQLQNSVSIRVNEDQNQVDDRVQQVLGPVCIDSSRSMNQNRPPRSGSMKSFFFSKYPRSHSTGHSLVQPGENVERFTLKLPDDVRKQILNRSLDRTTSLLILPRETSSRRGYRFSGEVSRATSYKRLESLDPIDKSDRWILTTLPTFLTRTRSVKNSKTIVENYEDTSPKSFINSFKKSFGRPNSESSESGSVSSASTRQPI